MGLWGDITSAGEHALHFAEDVATAASNELSNEAHTLMKGAEIVGHQAELFGEGVVTGALLNPINGVEQLVNHVAGTNLPPLEFTNQDEVNHSIAGKIGMVAGTVADFVLTDGAVSGLAGLEAGSALSLGITGAIEGGILTPSDSSKTGADFFIDRIENAGIDAVSFAAMGGVAGKVAGLYGDVGSAIVPRMVVSAESNAVGGAVGGLLSAEGNALKEGRLATADEVADQVSHGAAFGGLFGAASVGFEGVVDALRKPVGPGDAVLPRLPGSTDNPTQVADLIDVKSQVSGRFLNSIAKVVDDLPDPVLRLLDASGIKVVLGGKITDYDPNLAGVTPRGWNGGTWDNAEGLFRASSQGGDAVVTEASVDPTVNELVRSTREQGVARHEIGHAVDHSMGDFSTSTDFQQAYQQDLAQIPANMQARLDYYIQTARPFAGASEAFADLFAALHGGACNASDTALILKFFPRTAEAIKAGLAKLT